MSRLATISLQVEGARRGPSGDLESEWRPVAEGYDCEHYPADVALAFWIDDQRVACEEVDEELEHGSYRLQVPGERPAFTNFPYVGRGAARYAA